MKIGIIGAGNMGGAFYKGLLKEFSPEAIFVCDTNQEKIDALQTIHGSIDANEIVEKSDIIILAIKPQSFSEFIESDVNDGLENKLVISIMAGVSLSKIIETLGTSKVVRAMPNLPVQVEKGVIGWIATEDVSISDKGIVKRIFSTLGHEIEVFDELKINSITALSGSGPAYFFYLCEMIMKKAEESGFSKEEARQIAEHTFTGSAKLLDESSKTAKEWRKAVTSKGGTTEAALNYLKNAKVEESFGNAIEAAKKRSEELNQ